MRTHAGRPDPLGAIWDGHGVNFSLFSGHATTVDLCLFDRPDATVETHRITMPERTDQVWHCYLQEIGPGQLYGYRVNGPYDLSAGHRFNAAKLLLDPYATQIGRALTWHDALCDEPPRDGDHGTPDPRDTAPWAPLGVVANPAFDWGDDQPPRTRWADTVIYELHVKGFTWRHPEVPDHMRGTYLGLASAPVLHHLRALGVTAVELLPVHQHATERALVGRGMTDYWGYNSLGFLAPDIRYATCADTAVQEFKTMVRRLHAAGLEVILDIVYNHTATTIRQRGTVTGRPCRGAGSTTPPTTGCDRTTRARISTSRGAATPSTCGIRGCCNWSWTVFATGSGTCVSTGSGSTWRARWHAIGPGWT